MSNNKGLLTKLNSIKKDLSARQRKAAYLKDFHVWYISLVENTVREVIPALNSITKYQEIKDTKLGDFNYKNLSKEAIITKDGIEIMSDHDEWYHAFKLIKKSRYSQDGIDILSK